MVHLRIVVPEDRCQKVLDPLEAASPASSLAFLPGAPRQPRGDVGLCDIAREEASVLIVPAGVTTLSVQRALFERRRRRHIAEAGHA